MEAKKKDNVSHYDSELHYPVWRLGYATFAEVESVCGALRFFDQDGNTLSFTKKDCQRLKEVINDYLLS